MAAKGNEKTFNAILVGDYGVGKSSILSKFKEVNPFVSSLEDEVEDHYEIGVKRYNKQFIVSVMNVFYLNSN